MERLNKPQDVYVKQRRLITVFFVFMSLLALAILILLPIAFSKNPEESFTESEVKALVISLSCAAAVFGLFMAFYLIALVLKLRRNVLIGTDEKGIYLYSTLVPYGFIGWSEIKNVEYHGIFDLSSAVLAPDTNHLTIELRDKKAFKAKLNFLQKAFFTLNFNRLYCGLILCKGKGAVIGKAVREAWEYYSQSDEK